MRNSEILGGKYNIRSPTNHFTGMIRGRGQNRGRRGRGRRQTSSSIRGTAALPNTAPTNQGPSSLVRQPTLHPRVAFARMVDRVYDFFNDGINPTLVGYDFNLTILPQYLEWMQCFKPIVSSL